MLLTETVDLYHMIRADIPVSPVPTAEEVPSSQRTFPQPSSDILSRLSQLKMTLKEAQRQLEENMEDVTRLLGNPG